MANETGRRLSAILGLTYANLHTERTSTAPQGAITWPADTDKKGVEWSRVPVIEAARRALDALLRDRPGIGAAPLFPSPRDPSKPMDRHLADRWLRKAENLAWRDLRSMKQAYQHADPEGMLEAIESRRELGEAR